MAAYTIPWIKTDNLDTIDFIHMETLQSKTVTFLSVGTVKDLLNNPPKPVLSVMIPENLQES